MSVHTVSLQETHLSANNAALECFAQGGTYPVLFLSSMLGKMACMKVQVQIISKTTVRRDWKLKIAD